MPQFDPNTFSPQLFWLLVTFAVLFVAMWRHVLPRISGILEARQQRIGNDLEKAAALKVDSVDVLLGYADAVYERTKTYLAGVSPKELDRVLDEPQYDPMPTVGVRLVSVISDNTQHAGQIGYLRGYHAGFGWQQAR